MTVFRGSEPASQWMVSHSDAKETGEPFTFSVGVMICQHDVKMGIIDENSEWRINYNK